MTEAPKKGRLTLYEELLSAETRAEMAVKDAQAQAEEAKKKKDASLFFKPTNLGKKNNKPVAKPKPTFSAMHKPSSSTSTSITSTVAPDSSSEAPQISASSTPQPQAQTSHKRGFNDWLANEDEEWEYYEQKQDRGNSRKKKKKNAQALEQSWSWEDIYDPHTPVSFLDYPRSEVQYDINEAWKERLYNARKRERQRQGKVRRREIPDEDAKTQMNRPPPNMDFAPPALVTFPPPPEYNARTSPPPLARTFSLPRSDDRSMAPGDEAVNRLTAVSSSAGTSQPAEPPQLTRTPLLPPSSSSLSISVDPAEKAAKAAAQIAAFKAKLAEKSGKPTVASAAVTAECTSTIGMPPTTIEAASSLSPPPPPPPPADIEGAECATQNGVISAAPTYNPEYAAYKASKEASDQNQSESGDSPADSEVPRSTRPGQAGFGERYLKKHGHQQGQGLGARSDGIVTAIVMQKQKQKKKSDAEGGGYATPAMGKIVGGKRAKTTDGVEVTNDSSEVVYGNMSEVIKLEGMLAGMDVDKEIQDNDLLQEIGDDMGNFGTVERLFVWRQHAGGNDEVFIKFTSPLSALRAIRESDGQDFADNTIKARFWDTEKFERGEYR